MIQCPNCGKDIADDSAHCGFCGSKIETGAGKKTMIGFAALTGDRLKEAAEEAKRARAEAEQSDHAARPTPLPSRPSVNKPEADGRPKLPPIPRPTPAAGTPAAPRPPATPFATPRPAPAPPATPPDPARSGPLSLPTPDGDAPSSDAATAQMPAIGDAPSTVPEVAVDTDPKTIPISARAADTLPERPPLGRDGPTELGGGFDSASSLELAQNTLPQKKTNPALIAAGVLGGGVLLCCFAAIAYNVLNALM